MKILLKLDKIESQIRFLKQCSDKLGNKNFANALAELLGVNKDAAYRRMRGTTALTFDEIRKISLTFRVSVDSSINYQGSTVPFQFNAMFQDKFKILDYLRNIASQFSNLQDIDNAHMTLTLMDLPYFRQFGFPALSRFKLFYWQRSVLNLESYRHKKFDWQEPMPEYEEITSQVYQLYHGVDSREIWAPETLDSTVKQVRYFADSGLFVSQDSARQICDDLNELFVKLEREAELGKKYIQVDGQTITSKFEMYQSDLFLSNNCIQARRNDQIFTYVSFNSFNSLMSFNPDFAEECNRWVEQIRLKSILLSEVSEKLRYQFFQGLHAKLDGLRTYLGV